MIAPDKSNEKNSGGKASKTMNSSGKTKTPSPKKKKTVAFSEDFEVATQVNDSTWTLDSPSSLRDLRVRRIPSDEDHPTKAPIQSRTSSSQYVFLTLILLGLAWVCCWTVLSIDSNYNYQNFYSALQSDAFDRYAKTGGRLLTYTGVFYVGLGVITYVFLSKGIRLPRPSFWWTRSIRLSLLSASIKLSPLEALVMGIFGLVQGLVLLVQFVPYRPEMAYWPTERTVYEVGSIALGKTCAFALMLLLFPVSKNCFWWDLFNFQFERAIALHKALAWFLVGATILHIAISLAALFMAGEFFNCMWPNEECRKPGAFGISGYLRLSRVYTYGWIAALLMVPLVITSFQWFRRNRYEWFYYTHFLYLPVLVLLHLHYPELIYYMAPGLSAYILDKVVWFLSTRRATRVVNMEIPVPGYVRLTLAVDPAYSATIEPGQWVNIKIPAAHVWQWHPFSIASCPGDNTIAIDMKVLGDWTRRVAHIADRFDSSNALHSCVFVSPMYGSSHRQAQGYLTHPAVILVGAGIGVTPLLSGLRHILDEQIHNEEHSLYAHVQKVVFVWVVKTRSVIELYAQELAEYQAMGFLDGGCEVEVQIYVTKPDLHDENNGDGMPNKILPHDYQHRRQKDTHKHTAMPSAVGTCTAAPLMQYVMGHGHRLILTVLAGCGFLLGLYVANVIIDPHDRQDGVNEDAKKTAEEWRIEYVTLIQLCLGVCCSATAVAFGMSGLVSRPAVPWKSKEVEDAELWDLEVPSSSKSRRGSHKHHVHRPVLDTLEGFRPDLGAIFEDVAHFCQSRDLPSVGVAVCGPDALVHSVEDAAIEASIPKSLDFVVDDEHFGW